MSILGREKSREPRPPSSISLAGEPASRDERERLWAEHLAREAWDRDSKALDHERADVVRLISRLAWDVQRKRQQADEVADTIGPASAVAVRDEANDSEARRERALRRLAAIDASIKRLGKRPK